MASSPNEASTQDQPPTQNPPARESSKDESGAVIHANGPDESLSGPASGTDMTRHSGNPGASKIHTRANINADRAHDGNIVEDRGQQLNGDYKPPPNAPQHGGIWTSNGAKGDSQQINGDFHGDGFFRTNIGNSGTT